MSEPRETPPTAAESSPTASQEPLTLKRLSDAFAEMLGQPAEAESPAGGPNQSHAVPANAQATGRPQSAEPLPTIDTADDGPVTPQSILEAMLFVGHPANEPLRREQVAELIRGVELQEIDELIATLNEQYRVEAAPYTIVHDDAGWRLVLTDDHQRVRRRLGRMREARLSQAAIEVLALVAYNQPLSSGDIGRMRGRPSSHILSHLVRRHLLRLERSKEKSRTSRYFTTPRFLKLFGLSSLDELPQAQELEK